MIRFIDLGDQIFEGTREFAFFDTITDTFESFDHEQTWETWEDFETGFRLWQDRAKILNPADLKPLERYKRLFPKKWP